MPISCRGLLSVTLLIALGGCSGGGGGSATPPSINESADQSSLDAAQALGDETSIIKEVADSTNSPLSAQAKSRRAKSVPLATCSNGEIFNAPDIAHDTASTETQYFYDASCTKLARDVVRIVEPGGSNNEVVTETAANYLPNTTTPSSTRITANAWTGGSFDQYGFPIASAGYVLASRSTLSVGGTTAIKSSREQILTTGDGTTSSFCGDGAQYNVGGFAGLGKTTGSATSESGTRTYSGDGTITYMLTLANTGYTGAVNSLSLGSANANIACPITTPEFSIQGGSSVDTSNLNMTLTYAHGQITAFTVTHAPLSSGNFLDVLATGGATPDNSNFISGTISTAAGQILATITVDAFGDGILGIESTGHSYSIADWNVIK